MRPAPNLAEERALWLQGLDLVAGVDEVGRGPLAGPVVAAAVVLSPSSDFRWLFPVRGSKQLDAAKRGGRAPDLWGDAFAVGVGFVSHPVVDRIGIAEATRQAMLRAIGELRRRPQHPLIHAPSLKACSLPPKGVIDGDAA